MFSLRLYQQINTKRSSDKETICFSIQLDTLHPTPISLPRLNITFSRGLRSRPLLRQWPLHRTQISIRRMTLSSSKKKRSVKGPNLENTVNESSFRCRNRQILSEEVLAGALSGSSNSSHQFFTLHNILLNIQMNIKLLLFVFFFVSLCI